MTATTHGPAPGIYHEADQEAEEEGPARCQINCFLRLVVNKCNTSAQMLNLLTMSLHADNIKVRRNHFNDPIQYWYNNKHISADNNNLISFHSSLFSFQFQSTQNVICKQVKQEEGIDQDYFWIILYVREQIYIKY